MLNMVSENPPIKKCKDDMAVAPPAVPPVMIRPSRTNSVRRMVRYPEAWLVAGVFLASWYFGAEALLQL
jgi:hypothetical protein